MEFALVIPILLAFLMGIISYGYIMALQQTVTEAAAQGARAAALSAVEQTYSQRRSATVGAVNQTLGTFGMNCNSGGLSCDLEVSPCSADPSRTCAAVVVSYAWASEPRIPQLPLLPAPERIEHRAVVEVS